MHAITQNHYVLSIITSLGLPSSAWPLVLSVISLSLVWEYSTRQLLTVSLPQTGDPEGPRHQQIVLLTTATSVFTFRPQHSSRKDLWASVITVRCRSLVYDHVRYVNPGLKVRNMKNQPRNTRLSSPCFWNVCFDISFFCIFYNNGRDDTDRIYQARLLIYCVFSMLIFYNNSFAVVNTTQLSIRSIQSYSLHTWASCSNHCIWTSDTVQVEQSLVS